MQQLLLGKPPRVLDSGRRQYHLTQQNQGQERGSPSLYATEPRSGERFSITLRNRTKDRREVLHHFTQPNQGQERGSPSLYATEPRTGERFSITLRNRIKDRREVLHHFTQPNQGQERGSPSTASLITVHNVPYNSDIITDTMGIVQYDKGF